MAEIPKQKSRQSKVTDKFAKVWPHPVIDSSISGNSSVPIKIQNLNSAAHANVSEEGGNKNSTAGVQKVQKRGGRQQKIGETFNKPVVQTVNSSESQNGRKSTDMTSSIPTDLKSVQIKNRDSPAHANASEEGGNKNSTAGVQKVQKRGGRQQKIGETFNKPVVQTVNSSESQNGRKSTDMTSSIPTDLKSVQIKNRDSPAHANASEEGGNKNSTAGVQKVQKRGGRQQKIGETFNKPVVQTVNSSESQTGRKFTDMTSSIPTDLKSVQIENRDSPVHDRAHDAAPDDLSPVGSKKPIMTVKSLKNLKFPKNSKSRCFQLRWLERWSWLEYSVKDDATFCFACRLFNLNTTKEYTYTVTGYRDWVHASCTAGGYTKHESSVVHIQAMASWQEMLNREENRTNVDQLLTHHVLEKRRYYMKSVIEVIIFLITNEVAFRGNWDEDHHKEDGIFRNLFEFKLKDNKHLRDCQEAMPRNATYLSPEIQNELIEIIAKFVQKDIINEINSADVSFFTLLADGTKDRTNKEIVSVVIRYVKCAQAKESLLWFETTNYFDAESQADLLLKLLASCNLPVKKLLSQCYDGAFVMSGDKGGIQRIIQRIVGRIIPYVHCFNHKLHLVIIAAVESNDIVRLFFDTLKLVYNFFHRAKIQTAYEGTAILNLITTRWAGHHRSTNAILKNYSDVVNTLRMVKADTKKFDGDDIATATGILFTIQKPEFTFMLVFMSKFFNVLSPADKILQSVEIGFREALPVIQSVKTEISALRSSETFDLIWGESEELLQQSMAGVESQNESRPRRNINRPSSLSDFVITERTGERNHDSKIEISSSFYFVIDTFLSETERRFENNTEILSAISMAGKFDVKLLKPLEDLGIDLPSHEEMVVAKNYVMGRQLIHQEKLSKMKEEEAKLFKNRFNILKELYPMKEAFPAVYDFMATIDTFGCSTSTCETSFSALERLNPKSRMSMKNARLRHLSFLAFEKKRLDNISVDDILKSFNDNPKRRIQVY